MDAKKEHIMPAYRVPHFRAKEYEEALAYYGIGRTAMARAMMLALIEAHKAKAKLLFPLRFRTYGDGFPEDGIRT